MNILKKSGDSSSVACSCSYVTERIFFRNKLDLNFSGSKAARVTISTLIPRFFTSFSVLSWLLMHNKFAPLAIHSERRNEYITALDNARKGKVGAICLFCYKEYMKQYRFVKT